MDLSIYTHMTNPEKRMDPWKEGLECYSFFSDDVFSVGEGWEEEFKWSKIGKVFHEGFEKAEGDWGWVVGPDTGFISTIRNQPRVYIGFWNIESEFNYLERQYILGPPDTS